MSDSNRPRLILVTDVQLPDGSKKFWGNEYVPSVVDGTLLITFTYPDYPDYVPWLYAAFSPGQWLTMERSYRADPCLKSEDTE